MTGGSGRRSSATRSKVATSARSAATSARKGGQLVCCVHVPSRGCSLMSQTCGCGRAVNAGRYRPLADATQRTVT
jgi:hypothetical protein